MSPPIVRADPSDDRCPPAASPRSCTGVWPGWDGRSSNAPLSNPSQTPRIHEPPIAIAPALPPVSAHVGYNSHSRYACGVVMRQPRGRGEQRDGDAPIGQTAEASPPKSPPGTMTPATAKATRFRGSCRSLVWTHLGSDCGRPGAAARARGGGPSLSPPAAKPVQTVFW